jgi:pantetheine-phosphate adenylyltransferase
MLGPIVQVILGVVSAPLPRTHSAVMREKRRHNAFRGKGVRDTGPLVRQSAERKRKDCKAAAMKLSLMARAGRFNLKIAVYPGSFDPITNGHLDIVRRAAQMFDRVIVAVAINTEKTPLFSVDERRRLATEAVKSLRNVSVDVFGGLLIKYARHKRATAIVRGLRAVSDFEFEFQLALMNRKLDPRIETIFLMTKDEYTFISSRLVKEIGELGGKVSDFVPRGVEGAMRRKFGSW